MAESVLAFGAKTCCVYTKGLYAKARAGIVKEFTGISDPYEVPGDADLAIDTVDTTPEECAQQIILHLEKEGYIGAEG